MFEATGTEIIRKGSADEFVAKRNRALDLYRHGLEMLDEAVKVHKDVGNNTYAGYEINRLPGLEFFRKKLDADVWLYMVDALGLRNFMDAQAFKKFKEETTENPPEVTRDNLTATFARLMEDRQTIFDRGVVNVFKELAREYRTNKAFKIGDKIVLDSVLSETTGRHSSWGWNHYRNGREKVSDLDRIFHIVDGKSPPDHAGDAAKVVDGCRERPGHVETEYFEFKLFKNGNLHIRFKRSDLVKEINLIIARHYGAVVAHESARKSA